MTTPKFKSKEDCFVYYPLSLSAGHDQNANYIGVPADHLAKVVTAAGAASKYRCNLCQYHTSSKPSVYSHIRRVHLGICVACKLCGSRFYQGKDWSAHMEQAHREEKDNWLGDPTPALEIKQEITEAELASAIATPPATQ